MKKRNFVLSDLMAGLSVLGVVAMLLIFSGCEIDSAGKNDIRVTPAYAEIRRGQSLELSATGWEDFRWSLSNNQLGYLSATVGSSVIYTAIRDGGDETTIVEQIVTAQSVTHTAGSTTNRVDGLSATSRIRHL